MKKKLFMLFLLPFTVVKSQVILDSVTVSANRVPSSFNQAMREVHVISEKEIESAPVETLNELLEYTPGVDVKQRGGFDIQSDISLRGGTYDQTLILINGLKMNDPQTGHHSMNLPISYDLVEQVEVLQGGASRVFGPNAFAGAVNFRTKTSGENFVKFRLMAGQNGLFQGGVSAAYGGKNHYTIVSFDHLQSDGFRYNTDFNKDNIFVQSAIKIGRSQLIVNLGQNAKQFGAQTFYSANYKDQYEETKTRYASAKLTGDFKNNKTSYVLSTYYRLHNDKFELFREGEGFYTYNNGLFINGTDTVPTWYQDHNYHRTNVNGVEGNLTHKFGKWGTTSVGMDYRHENIVSNVLGIALTDAIEVPNEERGMYTKGDFRDNYSVYAEHNVRIKRFGASAGLLYNYNTSFGDDFVGGLDLSYKVSSNWMTYASYNQSFRFPTFTDLYYNLGGAKGSSTLKPEYSINYELGAKRIGKNSLIAVSLFRREGKELIDWVSWTADSVFAENITQVNLNGLNMVYGINKFENIKGLNQVSVSYSYMFADKSTNNYSSVYVLDFLTHKLALNLNHNLFIKNLTIDWRFTFQDRNGQYSDSENGGKDTDYANVFLLDAKLKYAWNNFDFFVEASNILDMDYVDRGNVYQPGFWARAGISYRFKY